MHILFLYEGGRKLRIISQGQHSAWFWLGHVATIFNSSSSMQSSKIKALKAAWQHIKNKRTGSFIGAKTSTNLKKTIWYYKNIIMTLLFTCLREIKSIWYTVALYIKCWTQANSRESRGDFHITYLPKVLKLQGKSLIYSVKIKFLRNKCNLVRWWRVPSIMHVLCTSQHSCVLNSVNKTNLDECFSQWWVLCVC